ncbi:MAG: hypothetical protein JWO38_4911 [Gemmataceae bacterium]|nr:hypothetical protein [Gemmataceae bacterium]
MHLPDPIPVVVPGPLPLARGVVHRGMLPTRRGHPGVPRPFIRVYGRPRDRMVCHGPGQCLLVRSFDDLQDDFPGRSADDPDHRRAVVGEVPVPPPLVRPAAGWVVRVRMRDPFSPRILEHLIGFGLRPGDRPDPRPPRPTPGAGAGGTTGASGRTRVRGPAGAPRMPDPDRVFARPSQVRAVLKGSRGGPPATEGFNRAPCLPRAVDMPPRPRYSPDRSQSCPPQAVDTPP